MGVLKVTAVLQKLLCMCPRENRSFWDGGGLFHGFGVVSFGLVESSS